MDDLEIDPEARARVLEHASVSSHPGLLTARVLLTQRRAGLEDRAAALFQSPPPAEDLAGWVHAATALYLADAKDGPLWEQWKEPARRVAMAGQGGDGGWRGATGSDSVVRTSLALHLLEIYYRYANTNGIASK
jgi:hypothetical protein